MSIKTACWTRIVLGLCMASMVVAQGCTKVEKETEQSSQDTEVAQPEVKKDLPLKYALVKTIDTAMKDISGIAIDGGDRIIISGGEGIGIFDSDGKRIKMIESSAPVLCVAVDKQDNIYAGLESRIKVYDKNGKQGASWGESGKGRGKLRRVTSIAVYGANVYVGDAGNRCVHRFDTTGDFIDDIGRKDEEAGIAGIVVRQNPYLDIDVASNGILYVTNPGRMRVEQYKADGTLIRFWGRSGRREDEFCGCCNPTNLLVLDDGRVATGEKAISRVKVYDKNGNMLALMGSEYFSRKAVGLDIAQDSKKRLYVIDPNASDIKVFALKK